MCLAATPRRGGGRRMDDDEEEDYEAEDDEVSRMWVASVWFVWLIMVGGVLMSGWAWVVGGRAD